MTMLRRLDVPITCAAISECHMIIPDVVTSATGEDVEAITAALGGNISGDGDIIGVYEETLRVAFGSKYCVAVSSGTAALSVAMAALRVGPRDEVIVAPTCPLCTLYPIAATGATVVFADTMPGSFGLAPDSVMSRATERTKAVVEVPMWGYPTPADHLRDITDKIGAGLVLDLAHCHGTTIRGVPMSKYGHISCFSTHFRKVISTGEGGFILTDDGSHYDFASSYVRFGKLDGQTFGINLKMGGLLAAIGIRRIRRLPYILERRRSNAAYLNAMLRTDAVREIPICQDGSPNYYALLLTAGGNTARFIRHMMRLGIPSDVQRYGCRPGYCYPIFSHLRYPCIEAERMLSTITTVPVHQDLTGSQLEYIARALECFAKEAPA